MLGEMTARQLNEWLAFAELEPFDMEVENARFAQIVAAIANVNRRKGVPAKSVAHFMLKFGDAVAAKAAEPNPNAWKLWKAQLRAAYPTEEEIRVLKQQQAGRKRKVEEKRGAGSRRPHRKAPAGR